MNVFIWNNMSPGDICMLTSAVRDLKKSHPEVNINVQTTCQELWNNNPYLDLNVTKQNANICFKAEYPLIHESTRGAYHFIHGFRKHLENMLKMQIKQGDFCVDIHLTQKQKNCEEWLKQNGIEGQYWLINAGCKTDYTNKMWEFDRFQQVVDKTKDKITWVQIGNDKHLHKRLNNVVDMINKTNHREFIQLMYKSSGVLTANSYAMHLSTIPMSKDKDRKRPCIVIAGGRQPSVWYSYTGHQDLNTCGMLPCCKKGACWKARVQYINDGNILRNSRICEYPVITKSGQKIPKCMDMITVDEVVNCIDKYMNYEENDK